MLNGCEAWSLTLREERRRRVSETRIPRGIFGPKRDENGEWKRLHNELHSLYYLPNIVRVIRSRSPRWAGYVARMEESRSTFKILAGAPTGKRPLGRLKEICIITRNRVDLAHDVDYWRTLVNAAYICF